MKYIMKKEKLKYFWHVSVVYKKMTSIDTVGSPVLSEVFVSSLPRITNCSGVEHCELN